MKRITNKDINRTKQLSFDELFEGLIDDNDKNIGEDHLKDISLDNEYFGKSYKKAKFQKNIDGKNAFQVAEELRDLLHLAGRRK